VYASRCRSVSQNGHGVDRFLGRQTVDNDGLSGAVAVQLAKVAAFFATPIQSPNEGVGLPELGMDGCLGSPGRSCRR
jgi:hypothetical protein